MNHSLRFHRAGSTDETAAAARSPRRARWAAIGAAVAVTVGGGSMMSASASVGSGERAVYVPITPCRIMDTRSAPETVGARPVAIGSGESYAIPVLGTNGNCTIPADAVGLVMNVAAVNPTGNSYLTVYPADQARPLAANLNWTAGQPPLSNAVTTDIGADGQVAFYNFSGAVDVAADIVGYYVDHNHDDVYYTKTQVDEALNAAKAATRPIRGFASSAGVSITLADQSFRVTDAFTATTDLICVVSSSAQIYANSALTPAGAIGPYIRNAMFVNGSTTGLNDALYGHYVASNGLVGYQGEMSRTSNFAVAAGQTVQFGGFLGATPAVWRNGFSTVALATSYTCAP